MREPSDDFPPAPAVPSDATLDPTAEASTPSSASASEPVSHHHAGPLEAAAPTPPSPSVRPSAPPAPSIVEVRGLSKRYGAVHALESLDLSVRRGEVYGFLGRNGAGKSTTIRILMGITEKTGGTVSLFGEPPSAKSLVHARERIGYVAQEQTFYGWMTPVRLGQFVGSFFPTWDAQELRRLAAKLEVPLDRKIQTFSGGMRVKVALAIALAHRPPLLLLDEPTAGLDPVARREFLEIVGEESKASGRTTFFSSHLIDEVELVAHRVGIVDGGRMRYEGSIRDLSARVRLVSRQLHDGLTAAAVKETLQAFGLAVHFSEEDDGLLRLFVEAGEPSVYEALRARSELGLRIDRLPLEEIFLALVRRKAPPLPQVVS